MDQLYRAADVADGDLAEPLSGGGVGEAGFFGDERDRSGGADAGAEGAAGVAVQAAGEVNRHDGAGEAVHGLDDLREGVSGGLGQAGAEEGVDDQAARDWRMASGVAGDVGRAIAWTICQLVRASPL